MKSPSRIAVLLLVALAIPLVPATALAQTSTESRPAVALTSLKAFADTIKPRIERSQRVWLAPWVVADSTGSRHASQPLEEAVLRSIQTEFPEARLTDDLLAPVRCPPGERLRMPGHACPIQDDGRIVEFMELSPEASDPSVLRLLVSVVTTGCDGGCTWMERWRIHLEYDDGYGWRILEFRHSSIT